MKRIVITAVIVFGCLVASSYGVLIGDFPGLDSLIKKSDAIVILRIDDAKHSLDQMDGWQARKCFVFQSLKGDLKKDTRVEVLLNHWLAMQQNALGFASMSTHLVFLHQTVRRRKCFTVLKFGLGISTLIMADALLKNKRDWQKMAEKPFIRCQTKFQLHTLDAEQQWISACEERLSQHPEIADIITFHFSGVSATTFNGRMCHLYDQLPNIVPDFIYLDAPGTDSVKGSLHGMEFVQCFDRTVMSADLCLIEPTLLPGCFIVVDGRTNNARFMKNNFQRGWEYICTKTGTFLLLN